MQAQQFATGDADASSDQYHRHSQADREEHCHERHADPDRFNLPRPFHRFTSLRWGETSIMFDLFDPAGRGIDVYFFLLSLRCDQFYFVHELAMFLV